MTTTLLPFRETKRRNHGGLHEGPYYGYALREVLSSPDEPSLVERHSRHPWIVVGIVAVIGAISIAVVVTL